MIEITKTRSEEPYDASIVFYFGDVRTYNDVHFIGLAIKRFQLLKTHELIIYSLLPPTDIRNYIATYKKDTMDNSTVQNIEFRQLQLAR